MTKPKAAKTAPKSNGHHNEQDNAQPRPSCPVKKREHTIEKFRGVLQDFNLSPKGGIEGFVLHSEGQTVQVNVSPDVGFAVVRGIGQNVEATVAAEPPAAKHSKAGHPGIQSCHSHWCRRKSLDSRRHRRWCDRDGAGGRQENQLHATWRGQWRGP